MTGSIGWLVLGVVLWSAVHLFPSAGARVRARVAERLGPPYQGLFALAIIGSLALIVLGWRSTVPTPAYAPPSWGRGATNVLMFVAILLFAGSAMQTNIKRIVRHPQLAGVAVWSVGHLLSNGEARSVVLFGALGLWALMAMAFINGRDGAWVKPDPLPVTGEWKLVAAAVVGFALLYVGHPYFAGVSPLP